MLRKLFKLRRLPLNTLECIKRRMSVRDFNDKEVERTKLEIICEAGLNAPTAMNSRDIVLTVVSGSKLLELNKAMEQNIPKEMHESFSLNGRFDFLRGGKALIVVSFGAKSVLPEQNTGCVMENMYLAATELGLGACWINQFYNFTDDKILTILQAPNGYRPFAGLSVGYYDKAPSKKERNGKVVFLN